MVRIIFLILTINFVFIEYVHALNIGTHKQINGFIASNSVHNFSLNAHLDKLGFRKGIQENFNGSTVEKLIRNGGEYEDAPWTDVKYKRSFNHYYNPLTNRGYRMGYQWWSSIEWMMMYNGTQSVIFDNYSWYDVRNYFYLALTSYDPDLRELYFAETFRGLGQLMHLVTDASVPSHTRPDAHLLHNYEDFTEKYLDINDWLLKPEASNFFAGTITSPTSFIDTDQYTYNNSFVAPRFTLSNTVGLSEFSNANFLSEDTIFQGFPNPDLKNTDAEHVESVLAEDGITDRVFYTSLTAEYLSGTGVPTYKLAGISYTKLFSEAFMDVLHKYEMLIDNNVYEDYTKILIPRAVGYSADMLKYFFRGDIALENDPAQGYIVRNKSSETMNGEFSVYYDYRGPGDAQDVVNRKLLASVNNSISPGQTAQISFNPPVSNDNETVIEPNKYIVAFKGTIGAEQNTAVAGWVGSVGPKEPWEDWEKGLSGKHGWTVDYSFGGSWTCKFSVVDSVNGAKKTKVLKIVDTNPYNTWATLDADVQDIPDSPTKVSFDYYVPNGFSPGNNWFSVDIRDDAGHWKSFYMLVGNYTGCDRNSCYKTMQTGGWQHAEFDIPTEWGMTKIKKVYIC